MKNRIKKIACILSLPATAMLLVVSCVADTQENKEMRNHSRGLDEVLHHYKHVDKDSLKYEAAVFLLENMPYHYSSKEIIEDSATLEKWRRETDALLTMLQSRYGYDAIPRDKIDSIRLERDSLYAVTRPNGITYSNNLLCDTALVTPEFLIQHIDNAFEVWHSNRFAKRLSFEEFKEYILPYSSLQYHKSLNNGNTLNNIFVPLVKCGRSETLVEAIRRYNLAIWNLRGLNGRTDNKSMAGIYSMYINGIHDCTDIATWGCDILRACGIPTVVENVIGYRDFVGKHYHCSVYDTDKSKWYPFNAESSLPGELSFEDPASLNVYRNTFSAQKNTPYFLRNENEAVPAELCTPCIKDVTSEYRKVHCITLPWNECSDNNLAYLATFNANGGRKVVTWGVIDTLMNRVTFENTLPGILYLPVYYTKDGCNSFFTPFYLEEQEGEVRIMEIPGIDNDTVITELCLTRKFPRKKKMVSVAEELVGGKFLGSNSGDFSKAHLLYTITKAPEPLFAEYQFKKHAKYQYYRFQAPENNPHANISHLEWITGSEHGYVNVEQASREHCLAPTDTLKAIMDTASVKLLDRDRNRMTWAKEYDGNMQTAPGAYRDITLSLDEPQIVTAVRFAPLNADNGIKAGNLYRLNYWDKGWKTCGEKVAEYEYLQFENVPSNKLYWLENLTEGKEEMPFTIVNGEQKFIYYDIIKAMQ